MAVVSPVALKIKRVKFGAPPTQKGVQKFSSHLFPMFNQKKGPNFSSPQAKEARYAPSSYALMQISRSSQVLPDGDGHLADFRSRPRIIGNPARRADPQPHLGRQRSVTYRRREVLRCHMVV